MSGGDPCRFGQGLIGRRRSWRRSIGGLYGGQAEGPRAADTKLDDGNGSGAVPARAFPFTGLAAAD